MELDSQNLSPEILTNKKKIFFVALIFIIVLGLAFFFSKGIFDWNGIKNGISQRGIEKEFRIEFPDDTEEDLLKQYQDRLKDYKTGALSDKLGGQVKGWLGLAGLRKIVKDYKGTEEALLVASKLDPKSAVCFASLANLYHYFLQDYTKAEEAYLKSLENNARDVNLYIEASNLYRLKLDNLSRAEDMLLNGLKYNPDNFELVIALADFYKETGDKEKAIEYFEKAIEILPERAESIQKEIDKLNN